MLLDRGGTWTYTGNPADSDKDRVRWLVGDVFDDDKQVSDEEITAAVTEAGNTYDAAAEVCDHLATRFAREAQKSVSAGGGLNTSVSLSERSRAYALRSQDLRRRAAVSVSGVHAGGITISGKDANRDDTDLVQPAFAVDLFEIAGTETRRDGSECE